MFLVKKLFSNFLTPFGVFYLLLFIAFILWRKNAHSKAKAIFAFALLWISLLSYYPLSTTLIGTLESQYHMLQSPPSGARFIHVLGSGSVSDPKFPISSQFNSSGLSRVIEGVRLYKKSSEIKMIFSGSSGDDPVSNARMNAKLAIEMGVDPADIIILEEPRDTHDEALADKNITGNASVILVTSAAHMPRSAALFIKAGVSIIPAPTDFLDRDMLPWWKFPSSDGLMCSESAFHEYIGLIWGKLTGII